MKTCLFAVLAWAFLPFSAPALEMNLATPYDSTPSPPQNPLVVFYSCQNDNLIFSDEKEIVIDSRAGLRCTGMSYGVCRNLFKTPFITGEAEALPADRFRIRIPTDKLKPGFYDINVLVQALDDKPTPAICTFGWKVNKMPVTSDKPADFDAFWAKGKSDLAKISLDPQVGDFQTFKGKEIDAYNIASAGIPGDYDPKGHRTEEVESAKVSFAGIQGRVYAYLAKPPGKGPFPAMLILPGAGFGARPRPLEHARHGYLAMDIQVQGQDVDLPGKYPILPGYYDHETWEPPQNYYYYHLYLNALQAVSYLASRPDIDKSKIVVVGGSQGGRLSVSISGLDSRVAATCPAIVHHANIPYLKWAEAANKADPPQDGMDRDAPPPLPDTPEGRTRGYFDTMNFAAGVHCPLYMNAGLIDGASPPSGSWAVFNQLGSKDKTITPMPGLAHDWSAEFDRRAWRWLDKELKLPPPPAPALTPASP